MRTRTSGIFQVITDDINIINELGPGSYATFSYRSLIGVNDTKILVFNVKDHSYKILTVPDAKRLLRYLHDSVALSSKLVVKHINSLKKRGFDI